jgi:hypothetical protein
MDSIPDSEFVDLCQSHSYDPQEELAMQYLLLIYHSEADWGKLSTEEQESIYKEYRDLREQLSASGKFRSGDQLRPAATAKTVRVRNNKPAVIDGPFAEAKEHLGGYFLVDVTDLDEALAIAARIPSARNGSVEVREVIRRTPA